MKNYILIDRSTNKIHSAYGQITSDIVSYSQKNNLAISESDTIEFTYTYPDEAFLQDMWDNLTSSEKEEYRNDFLKFKIEKKAQLVEKVFRSATYEELERAKYYDRKYQNYELYKDVQSFIEAGVQVPKEIYEKYRWTMLDSLIPDYNFIIDTYFKEKYKLVNIAQTGDVVTNEDSVTFNDGYFTLVPEIPVEGKNLIIKAKFTIDEVKDANYLLGTSGSDDNRSIHFGFRNSTTFTVALYADDFDVSVDQEVKEYDVLYTLNGETKEATIEINGQTFTNTYDEAYLGTIGFIGRDYSDRRFKGTLKELKLWIW